MSLNPFYAFFFGSVLAAGITFPRPNIGVIFGTGSACALAWMLWSEAFSRYLKGVDVEMELMRIVERMSETQMDFYLAIEREPSPDMFDFGGRYITETQFKTYLFRNLGTHPHTPSLNNYPNGSTEQKDQRAMIGELQGAGFVKYSSGKTFEWVKEVQEAIDYYFEKEL